MNINTDHYAEPSTNSIIIVASTRGEDGQRYATEVMITDVDLGLTPESITAAREQAALRLTRAIDAKSPWALVPPGARAQRYPVLNLVPAGEIAAEVIA